MTQQHALIIRDLLRQRGISLRQLATEAGISPSTLSRWTRGMQTPSPRSCRRFAEALSLPVEEMLASAGHLARGNAASGHEHPSLADYAQWRYPAECFEDMATMLGDLLPECFPTRRDHGPGPDDGR